MQFPPPDDLPDDPRLQQAVEEYLAQWESGGRPDRQELLRRYPDLAEPLAACLDGLDIVHKAAVNQTTTPPGQVPPGPGGLAPGSPLGDFSIVREIGRGGMGLVYEATQLSLGRRVALKVLPFAATFDPKHLQRFHNEAQAAAQLHHTNIVPVYAVGCERGVHFYAMQLIEGQSLADVIRQLRQAAGRPDADAPSSSRIRYSSLSSVALESLPSAAPLSSSPKGQASIPTLSTSLSTQRSGKRYDFFRSLAASIVQAANALEYAHQMGVVHRDVKPANLLVDAHGRLWITDFGLAQFHADAGLTQTGDIFGTLRYMSPEQAAGKRVLLDHRTDIYSLGATLYELVTLEPMFPGRNRQELLRQIIHEEPQAPRLLEKSIPVDLETIILKAVGKNPVDRYYSAGEMAADLQRFLDDKPILARRPSLIQRVRKWSRRHPSVVVSGVVLLLAAIAGLVINNRMIASEQAKTAQRAKEAEERFQLARDSVDELIEIAQEEIGDDRRLQNLRKRLLEVALPYYQRLIDQRRDDPDAQTQLAATRDRVKKIIDDLAVLQGAGQFQLLKEKAVLDDLQLSDGQRGRIAELSRNIDAQWHELFGDFARLTAEERAARFLEQARDAEAAVGEILSPEKLNRLRQIALQCQGPAAFRELDTAAELKLTAEQRERIRAIEVEMFFSSRGSERPGDRPATARKTPSEASRLALEQMQALLTDEQAQKWREMTGDPYRGPMLRVFSGPRAPGGPPDRSRAVKGEDTRPDRPRDKSK
jgi:serine/threonine protein kinase